MNYEEKGTAEMNEIMGDVGRMVYFSVYIPPIISIIIANERCALVQTMMVKVENGKTLTRGRHYCHLSKCNSTTQVTV